MRCLLHSFQDRVHGIDRIMARHEMLMLQCERAARSLNPLWNFLNVPRLSDCVHYSVVSRSDAADPVVLQSQKCLFIHPIAAYDRTFLASTPHV